MQHIVPLCLSVAVTVLASGARAQAPDQPSSQPAERRMTISSHYGDLNQQYDPTPGSEDRRSSYELLNPGFLVDPAAHADTDNPRAPSGRAYPFVLEGYEPFDSRTVIEGNLRFDVWFRRPGSSRAGVSLLNSTGGSLCQFFFGVGLGKCVEASGELRDQWMALTLDLTTGELSAEEIDQFGRPIAGRRYGRVMLGLDENSMEPRLTPRELWTILESAREGTLSGLVENSARTSFVSLQISALPRGPEPLLVPRSATERKGHIERGNPGSLATVDERQMTMVPEESEGSYVCEFDSEFIVGQGLRDSAGNEATLDISAAVWGGFPGLLTVEAVRQSEGEVMRLYKGVLGNSLLDPKTVRMTIKDWKSLLGERNSLTIRVRGSRKVLLVEDLNAPALVPSLTNRPDFQFGMLNLRFSVPTTPPTTEGHSPEP